jgi:iron complex transport system substrate-binding protein
MRRVFRPRLALSIMVALAAGPQAATAAPASPLPPNAQVAAGFSIEYRQGYKLVTVRSPWPGAGRGFAYALYKRGSPRPAGVSADRFVETPVRRVVTFSTTYVAQIDAIGETDTIVGVDAVAAVSSPAIRARIAAGDVAEAARNGSPDVERIIALAPDLVLAYGVGNEWDSHPKLVEAGLPVVIDGEWNEADPLARASWIEFVAAFYDKEAEARAYFAKVAAEYGRLKALAARAKDRPAVLVNGPFQGSWTVSGGRSYMARFIADAGGSYLWADDPGSGGLQLSIEAVYARALGARVWLNPGFGAARLADLAALDPRFASLPVAKAGDVWNNDLRRNGSGGNDYFESAVLNPQEVLADLVAIFHPELLPDRRFSYYRRLAR